MKYLILAFFVFSTVASSSQEISIRNYKLKIEKVINKKTITGLHGSVTAGNKKKYVGVKALFTPNSKKDKRLNIDDFVIKTDNGEYIMTIPEVQNEFNQRANILIIKKAKKRIIIAEVPKEFTKGYIYYLNKKIGEIVTDNNKEGKFKVIVN